MRLSLRCICNCVVSALETLTLMVVVVYAGAGTCLWARTAAPAPVLSSAAPEFPVQGLNEARKTLVGSNLRGSTVEKGQFLQKNHNPSAY